MSWDQVKPKTKEELTEAEKAQRDENIKRYAEILNDLYLKIDAAKEELKGILADIDGEHKKRVQECERKEAVVKVMFEELSNAKILLDQQKADLVARSRMVDDTHEKSLKKINDLHVAILAKQDQVDSFKTELDAQSAQQIEIAKKQKDLSEALDKKQKELNQFKADSDVVMNDIIKKRHDLGDDLRTYQINLDKLIEGQNQLEKDKQKNLDFYNAIVAREKEIEPLKKKYQDGIESNAIEAKRLEDKNLELFHKNIEIQKKLESSLQAEAKAKEQCDKLNLLKDELQAHIAKEN